MNFQTVVFALLSSILVGAVLAGVSYVRRTAKSKLAGNSLALLTALAGTMVMSAADEVRNLKDPMQPGEWTPEEAKRVKDRVLADVRKFGAGALEQIKALNGWSAEEVTMLLDRLVEQQVELLRLRNPSVPQLPGQ